MLRTRVERWWPDLLAGLTAVYGAERAPVLGADLVELAAASFSVRADRLHVRDLERMLRPDWLQDPSVIGYAAYTERFADDLRGVSNHLPYLDELGVRYLHLMPLLRPRDGDNDGGYAVADYRSVRPDLGTMDDLENLAARLHDSDMSLVLDLVLNHVAREHEWARRARPASRPTATTSTSSPTARCPTPTSAPCPRSSPTSRRATSPGTTSFTGGSGRRSTSSSGTSTGRNPAVLREYAAIILELANRGVDVLRLDAIAFMWKRLGTDCQGEPEVHALTQVLRAVTRIACPSVAFLAEAIVAPTKLLAYLGAGPVHREGERPRLPQQPHGAGLVDARRP